MFKTIRNLALVTFVSVALVGCAGQVASKLEKVINSAETLAFTTSLDALHKTVNAVVQSSPQGGEIDSETVIREGESLLGSMGYMFSPISLNQVGVTAGNCSTVLTLDAETIAEFIGVAECAPAVDE